MCFSKFSRKLWLNWKHNINCWLVFIHALDTAVLAQWVPQAIDPIAVVFNNSPDILPTQYRMKKNDFCFMVHSRNCVIDCFKQTSRRRLRPVSNDRFCRHCIAKSRSVRPLSGYWTPGARFRPGVFLECKPKNCDLTCIEKIGVYCAFLRSALMLASTGRLIGLCGANITSKHIRLH